MKNFNFCIFLTDGMRVKGWIEANHADEAYEILQDEMMPLYGNEIRIAWLCEHEI